MFSNLLIGPMVLLSDKSVIQREFFNLTEQDWIPIGIFTKGKIFKDIQSTMPPQHQSELKAIIISIGFTENYIS